MRLTKSPIIFDESLHTYHIGDRELSGVTPIVHWMFPDIYAGIPKPIMDNAADYGKGIHRLCNILDQYGVLDEHQSIQDYKRLKDEYGLKAEECEYLVSDNFRVASSIDVIYTDKDKNIILGDIKTTSKLLTECVTLQLSIYAYLFEKMNPKHKVSKLMCIWLPNPDKKYGTSKIAECVRVDGYLCERIITAYMAEDEPDELRKEFLEAINVPTATTETIPENLREVVSELEKIERQMKELKQRSDELRSYMLEYMQQQNVGKFDSDTITITRKGSGFRSSIDSTKLKNEFADVYEKCVKFTTINESLLIKIK